MVGGVTEEEQLEQGRERERPPVRPENAPRIAPGTPLALGPVRTPESAGTPNRTARHPGMRPSLKRRPFFRVADAHWRWTTALLGREDKINGLHSERIQESSECSRDESRVSQEGFNPTPRRIPHLQILRNTLFSRLTPGSKLARRAAGKRRRTGPDRVGGQPDGDDPRHAQARGGGPEPPFWRPLVIRGESSVVKPAGASLRSSASHPPRLRRPLNPGPGPPPRAHRQKIPATTAEPPDCLSTEDSVL
jgi:hypothetical protein